MRSDQDLKLSSLVPEPTHLTTEGCGLTRVMVNHSAKDKALKEGKCLRPKGRDHGKDLHRALFWAGSRMSTVNNCTKLFG